MDITDQIKRNNAIFKPLVKYMKFVLWMLLGFSMGTLVLFAVIAFQLVTIPQYDYFYYLMNLPSLGLILTFGLVNLITSIGQKRNLKLFGQSPEYQECKSTMFIVNTKLRHANLNIVAHGCLIASVVCLAEFLLRHGMEEVSSVSFMSAPSMILCAILILVFSVAFFTHAILNSRLDNTILDIQIELFRKQAEKNKNNDL